MIYNADCNIGMKRVINTAKSLHSYITDIQTQADALILIKSNI